MKRFTLVLSILIAGMIALPGKTNATIHNVEVEDFEFNPTTFIANVGDTVHWFWTEGFHTTTSFLIPAGAQPWDQPLFSSAQTFDYVLLVPGSYDYICSPHASMGMTGNITVVGTTGISENIIPSLNFTSNYVSNGNLYFNYSSPGFSQISYRLYDIVGQEVYAATVANKSAGIISEYIYVGNMPKGIYILGLFAKNSQVTRRIVIE